MSTGGRARTDTPLAGNRILSPARLPIPPLRRALKLGDYNMGRSPLGASSLLETDTSIPIIARQLCRLDRRDRIQKRRHKVKRMHQAGILAVLGVAAVLLVVG